MKLLNSTFYNGPLHISQLGGPDDWKQNEGKKPYWELSEEMSYYLGDDARKKLKLPNDITIKIIVEPGFLTDGGSFDLSIGYLINATGTGKYFRAFIIHDAVSRTDHFNFKEANIILDETLKLLGMGWWSRKKCFYGLQTFGSPTKKPELLENAKKYVKFEVFELLKEET